MAYIEVVADFAAQATSTYTFDSCTSDLLSTTTPPSNAHTVSVTATNTPISSIAAPCTFTDRVPTEIRKEIFSYVLTKEKPIKFQYIQPRNDEGNRTRKWVARPQTTYNTTNHRYEKIRHRLGAELLSTCKLFHLEASEVLFSCNVFSFPTTTAVISFVETIGGPKYAIKAISVDQYVKNNSKAFWLSLLPLVNLRSISLPHDSLCQNRDTCIKLSLLQLHMKPLLRTLRTAYDQRQQSIDLQALVQVRSASWGHCLPCVRQSPELRRDGFIGYASASKHAELEAPEVQKLKDSMQALIAAALQ